METSKATVNTYDYGETKAKKIRNRVFKIITGILERIIVLTILGFGSYTIYKYLNNDAVLLVDRQITKALENVSTYVKDDSFAEESILINFPDTTGIVSEDGFIKNDIDGSGKIFKDFEDGYILMYKDGRYIFNLQTNGYCAVKPIDSNEYRLKIYTRCTSISDNTAN